MPRRRWTWPLLLTLLLTVLIPLPATAAEPSAPRPPAPPVPAAARSAADVPLPSLRATTTQVASGLRRPTA
ncbi:hypothetical protein GTW38_28540, partial [Streptomyces sp. SID7804]|nr:hypothetical protein [Streptomyces sp. SID7804]